ncbi:unnamed protein product, partial [Rotaria sp. Silwood2]
MSSLSFEVNTDYMRMDEVVYFSGVCDLFRSDL